MPDPTYSYRQTFLPWSGWRPSPALACPLPPPPSLSSRHPPPPAPFLVWHDASKRLIISLYSSKQALLTPCPLPLPACPTALVTHPRLTQATKARLVLGGVCARARAPSPPPYPHCPRHTPHHGELTPNLACACPRACPCPLATHLGSELPALACPPLASRQTPISLPLVPLCLPPRPPRPLPALLSAPVPSLACGLPLAPGCAPPPLPPAPLMLRCRLATHTHRAPLPAPCPPLS